MRITITMEIDPTVSRAYCLDLMKYTVEALVEASEDTDTPVMSISGEFFDES